MSAICPTTTMPKPAAREVLPVAGLLALALLGFIAILTETLPAGLLPQIGRSLGVGDALSFGARSFAPPVLLLALMAVAIVLSARIHGFPAGIRAAKP